MKQKDQSRQNKQEKLEEKDTVEQEVVNEQEEVSEREELVESNQQHEYGDMKAKYLRAVADYRNLEHRIMKERKDVADRCRQEVISSFLPVLDNLNKAKMFIADPGLKMIMDQFMQTLELNGVREVPLKGKQFDPHAAECIEVVEGTEDDDGVILEVVRNAYELNGKIIQHGQVKVSQHQTKQ